MGILSEAEIARKERSTIERTSAKDPLRNFSLREPLPVANTNPLGTTLFLLSIALAFLALSPTASFPQSSLATDCTLYAAANGNDANSGTSPSAPKTLNGANAAAQPGAVVCLKGGTYNLTNTFYPARSGTAAQWIVFKNYGDSDVNIVWATGDTGNPMIHMQNGRNYIEFRGLRLDGVNVNRIPFKCNSSHHLRFIGNHIKYGGVAGIATKNCDYTYSEGNQIYHNGYNGGWGSGISYNSDYYFDTYAGFHNYVLNNIISGTFDSSSYHTDGNGIMMDLGGSTPPVLIANNVVYMNGGRCINYLQRTNVWIVNNTCYKNGLDLSATFAEFTSNQSSNGYFVNNIAWAWNNRQTYQNWSSSNIQFYKNLYYEGGLSFTPSDPSQWINANPQLVDPPVLNPTAGGQYANAIPPEQIGNRLNIRAGSPAIDKGIDPTTIPGVSAEIIAGLRQHVFKDITGKTRPQGSGFDLGAYEYGASSTAPAAPTALRLR